jgi:hypothetical protein
MVSLEIFIDVNFNKLEIRCGFCLEFTSAFLGTGGTLLVTQLVEALSYNP